MLVLAGLFVVPSGFFSSRSIGQEDRNVVSLLLVVSSCHECLKKSGYT